MGSRMNSSLNRIFDEWGFVYFSKICFFIGFKTEILELGGLANNLELCLLKGPIMVLGELYSRYPRL